MSLSPAVRQIIRDFKRSPIKEQRFQLAPPGSKGEMNFYPIDALFKAVRYLMKVEDRMLPVAFFAEPRYGFTNIIGLYQRLKRWKADGYTHVLMAHGADPTISVHQPFGRFYMWKHRLKTLKHIEPIRK